MVGGNRLDRTPGAWAARWTRRRIAAGISWQAAMLALAAAMAAGCASMPAYLPTRTVTVRVPVLHETPCPAPRLENPALPIGTLQPASAPADTIRAYAASVAILKGAVRERDAVIAGCARAADKTNPAGVP